MLLDPSDMVLTQKALFRLKCIFKPLGLQRVLYHLRGDRKIITPYSKVVFITISHIYIVSLTRISSSI